MIPDLHPLPNPRTPSRRAFTLVEVILALGIVAVAGGLLLTSLAQSVKSEGKGNARESAIQLEDVIRSRLNEVDFYELYTFLKNNEAIYYAYQYRADPRQVRDDGTFSPASGPGSQVVPGFRRRTDPDFLAEIASAEGDIFRLRLTPFLYDPGEPYTLPTFEEYEPGALRVFVEVYQDFTPGENVADWPNDRRVLSFPIALIR
ncbi:MAG: type II secretion system protein [Verrucomicrobiae bacterium]|nr:type II secretion system protein [Verrucomicrobiae bacterium]